ncbi:MAG: thiol peroxidase [Planctomycetota bacterium]
MSATLESRPNAVTLKGNPMTLVGPELSVGDKAPDFALRANDMSVKTLADYAGKTVVLSVVPSLDTPVCDTETRRFNEEAGGLDEGVVILTVSVDLPMAQKRWCGAAGVEAVECLSDFQHHAFGKAYGVRIDEIGLLARTVFVIDGEGVIKYVQRVPEVAEEPDYAAVLEAVKAVG